MIYYGYEVSQKQNLFFECKVECFVLRMIRVFLQGFQKLGEILVFEGRKISIFYFIIFLKVNLLVGLEGLSDFLGIVNDWFVVYVIVFFVIWVSVEVLLGRDRRQFVMYKFYR